MRNKRSFFLPAVSAGLLIGALYPFHLSFLIFIAFVPLFYFIFTSWERTPEVFWGLFCTGFLSVLSISYVNLSGFLWEPDAHLFQTIVQFLPFPIALISGVGVGVIGVLGSTALRVLKAPRTPSLPYLLFALPACLTLLEIGLTSLLRGYDFSILAYVLHNLPFFVGLASIGGAHFVSFLIAVINAVIATGWYIFSQQKNAGVREAFYALIPLSAWVTGLSLTLCLGASGYVYYLHHDEEATVMSISVLQNTDTFGGMFGTLYERGTFRYPLVEDLIREAEKSRPEVIIYPYAFADYTLQTGPTAADDSPGAAPLESIARWTAATAPHTTLVSWDSTARDGEVYSEIHFWKSGALYGTYAKRFVFPFMDYTPRWAQRHGFYTTSFDLTPRLPAQPLVSLEGVRFGNAICSEINERGLVRENAEEANLLLSIGSDAMFTTHMTDEFTLASAQFRAAENNRPVVRANRMGPSAFIDAHGTILSSMRPGQSGVLSQEVVLETHPRKTLYQITGDWLTAGVCLILLAATIYRRGDAKK